MNRNMSETKAYASIASLLQAPPLYNSCTVFLEPDMLDRGIVQFEAIFGPSQTTT